MIDTLIIQAAGDGIKKRLAEPFKKSIIKKSVREANMDIQGLQKLTLLDYPGKTACTVFLAGCNLRCPFCHNSGLLSADVPAELDSDGLLAFLKKRQGLLDGVAVTGGEPTLRPELPELLSEIRALGYAVKLDTNGTFPERLRRILEAGLVDYVAMDVKNSPERYAQTTGCTGIDLEAVKQSLLLLLNGNVDYELRTTVVEELHDEEAFRSIGRFLAALSPDRKPKRYFLQSFTDRDSVLMAGFHAPRIEALRSYREILQPYVECCTIRGRDE